MQGAAAQAQALDAARGLAPAIGDPLSNAKAAATLQDLDPSGRIFPIARTGMAPAIADALRMQEESDGWGGGSRPDSSWARIGNTDVAMRERSGHVSSGGRLML